MQWAARETSKALAASAHEPSSSDNGEGRKYDKQEKSRKNLELTLCHTTPEIFGLGYA